MPIYEYLCEGCGRISELMQKMTDPPPRSCPECGSRKVAKLVSRTAFQLKGGGWYSDLYASPRKDAKKDATGDGGAAGAKTEGGEKEGGAKSDAAKPAAAAPAGKDAPKAPPAPAKPAGTRGKG